MWMLRPRYISLLLTSSALIFGGDHHARAQSVQSSSDTGSPTVTPAHHPIRGSMGGAKQVHVTTNSNARVTAGKPEVLTVSHTRRAISHNSENVIGKKELAQQVPGQNVLKAVGQLPGVSYSSTDPLGIDTWGASVYMRGFFMNQLGVTLDGVPLNDQTYTTTNGLNIANAWISDDIGRVSVSQGAGAVDLPSNTNLGGTMQFFTADPKEKAGATVSQGFGSYAMKRTYVRVDSGKLNKTGTRFYVAYSRDFEKKYDADSPDFMQQVNAKLVQPIGEESKMTAFFNWNNAEVYGYLDKSLGSLQKYGWRQELLYPNYAQAYSYAEGNYPSGWNSLTSGNYTQLYDAGQSTQDYIGGINFDLKLANNLRWKTTLYAHRDLSNATYSAPGTYSPGTGAPLSEQVWMNREMREGFNTYFEYKIGNHTINTGAWYENNSSSALTDYFNEPALGHGAPLTTTGPYTTYGQAFATGWAYKWSTNTFQYHVMDTWRILPNFTATYGFKSMLQTTAGGDYAYDPTGNYSGLTNPGPTGSMTSAAAFLPAVNLDWRFLPGHELYFDFAENMRPYSASPYASANEPGPWMVQTQSQFNQLKKTLTPERDFTYVLGYRYSSRLLTAGIDGYHSDNYNRLISAASGIGGGDQSASFINSKHASQWGMDAVLTITPVKGLAITNSVSYNHFAYAANVPICLTSATTGCYNLRGKKMDGYPSVMYKANLSYTWHKASAYLDVNYYSKRQYSLLNDTHVPAYWLANLGASYHFGKVGFLHNVTASFTVYNLFNAKYISMMGENGFPASGDMQSIERGAVREYFGTIKAEY
ncbi:vitamin B12 transporter BtuB [Komagataeibacter europaeus]|uniref:Vitamin B12 transporter BtuB n=1 Tax=Komagataeibacter europaeus TaxID=33995 RepID=A0A0M0EIC0_KOMEU|nr:vitamin B12 transporter BtuB [Komagataeibacter europaeus]